MSLFPALGLVAVAVSPALAAVTSPAVPSVFHGRWDMKSGGCADQESLGLMQIGADKIGYWETTDYIVSVKIERADVVRLTAKRYDVNDDEQEKPTAVSMRLELVEGGKSLKVLEKGHPPVKFARCSDA